MATMKDGLEAWVASLEAYDKGIAIYNQCAELERQAQTDLDLENIQKMRLAYVGLLEESVRLSDNCEPSAKINFNRGVILATIGEHKRAIEEFREAIRRDQYYALAYYLMGTSYYYSVDPMEVDNEGVPIYKSDDDPNLMMDFEKSYISALQSFEAAFSQGFVRNGQMVCTHINYTRLDLNFLLFGYEILFNQGICYLHLGQEDQAMELMNEALSLASQTKKEEGAITLDTGAVPDFDVIDECIKEHAFARRANTQPKGYVPFTIPVGLMYRPKDALIKNMKEKDFLGKAKLVATSDAVNNTYTGFSGAEKPRKPDANLLLAQATANATMHDSRGNQPVSGNFQQGYNNPLPTQSFNPRTNQRIDTSHSYQPSAQPNANQPPALLPANQSPSQLPSNQPLAVVSYNQPPTRPSSNQPFDPYSQQYSQRSLQAYQQPDSSLEREQFPPTPPPDTSGMARGKPQPLDLSKLSNGSTSQAANSPLVVSPKRTISRLKTKPSREAANLHSYTLSSAGAEDSGRLRTRPGGTELSPNLRRQRSYSSAISPGAKSAKSEYSVLNMYNQPRGQSQNRAGAYNTQPSNAPLLHRGSSLRLGQSSSRWPDREGGDEGGGGSIYSEGGYDAAGLQSSRSSATRNERDMTPEVQGIHAKVHIPPNGRIRTVKLGLRHDLTALRNHIKTSNHLQYEPELDYMDAENNLAFLGEQEELDIAMDEAKLRAENMNDQFGILHIHVTNPNAA